MSVVVSGLNPIGNRTCTEAIQLFVSRACYKIRLFSNIRVESSRVY